MIKHLLNRVYASLKTQASNEKGNILAVTLIVITILTFSVSSITGLSINLATSTTIEVNDLSSESEAKAQIKMAITEFTEYMDATGDFDTYITAQIPLALSTYNVVVEDITSSINTYGGDARIFRFSYDLIGRVIYMDTYVSTLVIAPEIFAPFAYTMGTSGDLVLNSGYYDAIDMFGNNIYVSDRSPFIVDGSTTQKLTSDIISEFPVFTTSSASGIDYSYDLQFCASGCFDTNILDQPFVMDKTDYQDFIVGTPVDQGEIVDVTILDFFGNFSYNDFAVEFIEDIAPKGTNTMSTTWNTLQTDVIAQSDPLIPKYNGGGKFQGYTWPTSYFVDITGTENEISFSSDFKQGNKYYSMVYEDRSGNNTDPLHIDQTIKIFDDESLIVFGDLYLDATASQNIEGQILVSGDLYITGGSKDFEGSIIVFGETFINFDYAEGLTTNGNNIGFTIVAKDNIHWMEMYESHTSSAATSEVTIFIYTEESIYIDAVNSRINMTGALFARALGASGNSIFMEDELGAQIDGIVINSFYGHINVAGNGVDGSSYTSNGFRIAVENNLNYAERFLNIPTFESIVVSNNNELIYSYTEFVIN
jgi:hypothetical protein